jgi:hypothetical protein
MSKAEYHLQYPDAPLRDAAHDAQSNRADVKEVMARRAALYITHEQLKECRRNLHWEILHNVTDCVICRRCGKKIYSVLGDSKDGHIGYHRLTWDEYQAMYRGAPRSSPERRAQMSTRAREERRKLMTVQAENERLRARQKGRERGADTEARITLAAHLGLQGMTMYKMKDQLYPHQGTDAAYQNTKNLFRDDRYGKAIKLEEERLAALSENERHRIAAVARARLASQTR